MKNRLKKLGFKKIKNTEPGFHMYELAPATLQTHKEPKWGWVNDSQISILWSTEDVKYKAGEMKIKLNKQQCRDVLDKVLKNHDANYGISWDSLRFAIDDLNDKKNQA